MIIKDSQHQQRHSCEYHIIECNEPIIIDTLGRIQGIESKQELRQSENDILKEEIENHSGDSIIVMITMEEQQSPNILELSNSKITTLSSPQAFITIYSNAYICCLYHIHIICTISYCQTHFLFVLLHQSNHLCFLLWSCSTYYHTLLFSTYSL